MPRIPVNASTRARLLRYRKKHVSWHDEDTEIMFLLEHTHLSSCRHVFIADGMIFKLSEYAEYWQNLSEWEVLHNDEFRTACSDNGILIPKPIHMSDDGKVVVSEYIDGIVKPYSTNNDAIDERASEAENYLRTEWQWGDSHSANWGYRPYNDKFYLLDLGSFGHLCE
ncbi:hypothetical protein KC963_00645 [Candidatus Saccharibacteria bacterium]|nr:hypothetical protein [Candidatus Saccharibacteria bacterium]